MGATLAGTAFGGAAAGLALAWLLAPGSAAARFTGFLALPLVLGLGYQFWQTRIASIVARRFGKGLMTAIWQVVVARRRPQLETLMPTPDDARMLMEQMLRGTIAFTHAGVGIGLVAAPLFGLASDGVFLFATILFFLACAGFGRLCTRLARRGYLPPPDGSA